MSENFLKKFHTGNGIKLSPATVFKISFVSTSFLWNIFNLFSIFFLDFLLCEVFFLFSFFFHKFHLPSILILTILNIITINFIIVTNIVGWLWHCTYASAAGSYNKIIISHSLPFFSTLSSLFPSYFFPLPSLQTACKYVLILPPTFE